MNVTDYIERQLTSLFLRGKTGVFRTNCLIINHLPHPPHTHTNLLVISWLRVFQKKYNIHYQCNRDILYSYFCGNDVLSKTNIPPTPLQRGKASPNPSKGGEYTPPSLFPPFGGTKGGLSFGGGWGMFVETNTKNRNF